MAREEQSRAECSRLEESRTARSHELAEMEQQLARLTVQREVLETDVQTAEDRCAQLQELCAEAHGRLDELGSAEANKEAELVEADLRLQSLQSLILAGNHKVLEAKSAIRLSLFWMAFAVEFDLLLRGYSMSTRCRYLLCDSFLGPTRREGGGAQPCRACKARGELECNGCYVG